MRRREVITLISTAMAAWPLVAHAQQLEPMRRIGFLSTIAENDPENQTWIRHFTQRLEELGWTSDRR